MRSNRPTQSDWRRGNWRLATTVEVRPTQPNSDTPFNRRNVLLYATSITSLISRRSRWITSQMASHRDLCQYLLFSTESTFRQANSTHLLASTSTRYFLNCHSNTNSVTPLTSRTNSVWTALSGIIRIYAAYNIHNAVYRLSKGK